MWQQRQREVIHSELVPQISYWLRENDTEKDIYFLFIISCHATGQMIDCICNSRYALNWTVLYCTLICSAYYCRYTSVDINISEYTYALHNFERHSLSFYSLTLLYCLEIYTTQLAIEHIPCIFLSLQSTALQINVTQLNTIQYNTIQHYSTQHNTTRHNTTQHYTTLHNTLQVQSKSNVSNHLFLNISSGPYRARSKEKRCTWWREQEDLSSSERTEDDFIHWWRQQSRG